MIGREPLEEDGSCQQIELARGPVLTHGRELVEGADAASSGVLPRRRARGGATYASILIAVLLTIRLAPALAVPPDPLTRSGDQ
jgi:hypothetical protein